MLPFISVYLVVVQLFLSISKVEVILKTLKNTQIMQSTYNDATLGVQVPSVLIYCNTVMILYTRLFHCHLIKLIILGVFFLL
jgi:hypothetical protein